MKLLVQIFVFFVAFKAFAATLTQEWEPVQGAEYYEYQISKTPDFSKKDQLIENSQVKTPKIKVSLPMGIYYVRVRGATEVDGPGHWSQTFRVFAQGEGPTITVPKDKEVVEKNSVESALVLEWDNTDGAEDYEVILTKIINKKEKNFSIPRSVIESSNRSEIRGLEEGDWQAKVIARANGMHLATGNLRSFSIKITNKDIQSFKILVPTDNHPKIYEFEEWNLQWDQGQGKSANEIEITRMGSERARVLKTTVEGNQFEVPALPMGVYQLTLQGQSQAVDEEMPQVTISFSVIENPQDIHSDSFGVKGRIFSMGPTFGQRKFTDRFLDPALKYSVYSKQSWFSLEARGEWQIVEHYKVEAMLGSEMARLVYSDGTTIGTGEYKLNSDSGPVAGLARFSVGYVIPKVERYMWLSFKAGIYYRYLRQFVREKVGSTAIPNDVLTLDNYGMAGLSLAADYRWRFKHSWDYWAEFVIQTPFLLEKGNLIGRVSAKPIPNFLIQNFLRKRVTREFRVGVGLETNFEWTNVSEGDGLVATTTQFISIGPRFSLEWDL